MKNVFVFPCGSEIALEIARSLSGDRHFHLIGGASVKDHGRFVYNDIVEDVPWLNDEAFLPYMAKIVKERQIDLIYPAMDNAAVILKRAERFLGCPVVTSPIQTVETCYSKRLTYSVLSQYIRVPIIYAPTDELRYPIFAKPDVGYGSRGAAIVRNAAEKEQLMRNSSDMLLLEYLPGDEYTVDCFSNRHGELMFSGARIRDRIVNGISVHTMPVAGEEQELFSRVVKTISSVMEFHGAWFAQFKKDEEGKLVLLEVAARLGGSSGLYRGLGINFAVLSLWDALCCDVSIIANCFSVEMDRSLDNKYKLDIHYNEVFLDYDDTVVMSVDGTVNAMLMGFVFACRNRGIKVTILSRHQGNLMEALRSQKIEGLFSRVIHVPPGGVKSDYIDNPNSIFIDDSFAERRDVLQRHRIPVFGLDMIDALM